MTEHYRKKRLWLQGFLQGQGMYDALRAIEFASKYHVNLRRDKVTPEFEHQISQACYAVTLLPHLRYPEETICTIIYHDLPEDYSRLGVTFEMLAEVHEGTDKPKEFVGRLVSGTRFMTKEYKGVKLSPEDYYGGQLQCPIATFAKPVDRHHNHASMNNLRPNGQPVFGYPKQMEYITETKDWILPNTKKARRLYPDQHLAYMNVTTALKGQIEMVEAIQRAAGLI